MKNKGVLILVLIFGILFSNCEKADSLMTTCYSEGGLTITGQNGQIYKWTNSLPHFYYIGNIAQVSNGINETTF